MEAARGGKPNLNGEWGVPESVNPLFAVLGSTSGIANFATRESLPPLQSHHHSEKT